MAILHLIHGFVGAGKTTFSRTLEAEISAIRFTLDEWIIKLYGHNPPEDKFTEYSERVSSLIWQLTRRFLNLGQDVILDFGFWTRASRDLAREFARSVNAEVKLYSICCSDLSTNHLYQVCFLLNIELYYAILNNKKHPS